jgi:hypothetical protein
MPQHELLWIAPAFLLLWVSIFVFFAYFSGWHELAQQFRATEEHAGRKFRFVSAAIGRPYFPVSYNNCLSVTVGDAGLTLGMLPPFRIFHPTLFIPWSAVESIEPKRIWFFKCHVITLRDYSTRIALRGAAGRAAFESFSETTTRE